MTTTTVSGLLDDDHHSAASTRGCGGYQVAGAMPDHDERRRGDSAGFEERSNGDGPRVGEVVIALSIPIAKGVTVDHAGNSGPTQPNEQRREHTARTRQQRGAVIGEQHRSGERLGDCLLAQARGGQPGKLGGRDLWAKNGSPVSASVNQLRLSSAGDRRGRQMASDDDYVVPGKLGRLRYAAQVGDVQENDPPATEPAGRLLIKACHGASSQPAFVRHTAWVSANLRQAAHPCCDPQPARPRGYAGPGAGDDILPPGEDLAIPALEAFSVHGPLVSRRAATGWHGLAWYNDLHRGRRDRRDKGPGW